MFFFCFLIPRASLHLNTHILVYGHVFHVYFELSSFFKKIFWRGDFRAIPSRHKVRSSRLCVGRFPLGLDDLTLWHDELPDHRETLLRSHVSLKTSASFFWPPLNPSHEKKSFPTCPSPERRQARSVTSRTGWSLRIGFRHPCLKI